MTELIAESEIARRRRVRRHTRWAGHPQSNIAGRNGCGFARNLGSSRQHRGHWRSSSTGA